MAFCAKCGAKIDDGVRFCQGCGTPVEAPAAAQQTAQQAAGTNKNPWQYFVVAVKKYVVASGRARRAEFWWFVLISGVISFVAGLIDGAMGLGNILSFLASGFFLLPSLAICIRRMHDLGKSGWYVLVPIYDIVLWATAGNTGPNQYGNDPKSE